MSPHGHKSTRAGDFVSSIWSFPGREPSSPYRWFGTLPRGLTDRLVDMYPSDFGLLDAFSGTATALLSASERGMPGTGYDVNPLSVLVARSRLSGLQSEHERSQWLGHLSKWMSSSRNRSRAQEKLADVQARSALEYTQKWFEQDNLASIWLLLQGLIATGAPLEGWPTFATAVRELASVDPRCTHHLVRKKRPSMDALAAFASRAESLDRSWFAGRKMNVEVKQGSYTSHHAQAGLVLAHPPYEGVINYHAIHRLTTDLMAAADVSRRVAAASDLVFDHPTIRDLDASSDNKSRYSNFIERFCDWAPSVTAPCGRVAIIVGDSRHKGLLRHPFSHFISSLEQRGLALEEMFIWVLQHNAGMHVLRRGNFIDHNYVMIFRGQ